jgi:nucleotide-binding universal stress UspA family protein
MRVLLAATDFSSRSHRALYRAAVLARQLGARLVLLHVVKADRPSETVSGRIERATMRLEWEAPHIAKLANSSPEIVVRAGDPLKAISAVAQETGAELVVVGAHRKRPFRDLFTNSTIARLLRVVRVPLLLVNRPSTYRYHRVLLATDLSDASARAVRVADALALLDGADVAIVHAFQHYAKGKLAYAGVSEDVIAAHVAGEAREALREIVSSLRRDGLNVSRRHIVLDEAHPVPAIQRAVKQRKSELLVVGTRGRGGLDRILLGSIAAEAIRRVDCDVLAVPPAAPAPDQAQCRSAPELRQETVPVKEKANAARSDQEIQHKQCRRPRQGARLAGSRADRAAAEGALAGA